MINRNQKGHGASKRYGLYQASVEGDLRKYKRIEARWFNHWGLLPFKPVVESPMAQFDESHKRWIENGREC